MQDNVMSRGAADELLVEVQGPVRNVTLHREEAFNAADESPARLTHAIASQTTSFDEPALRGNPAGMFRRTAAT